MLAVDKLKKELTKFIEETNDGCGNNFYEWAILFVLLVKNTKSGVKCYQQALFDLFQIFSKLLQKKVIFNS